MGDLPLRTPSHRRHGGPLPRRLPNGTRADPYAINLSTPPHAGKCVTGYYATFPSTIPHIRARCSRVTHPFAGRRHLLLDPLPLDLHVLSLPLAFILSQDQTLHCIFFINLSLSSALVSLKKLTLVCTCFLVLSFSLFNELFVAPTFRFWALKTRSFPNGIAKVHFIFELANFFQTFLKNFLT